MTLSIIIVSYNVKDYLKNLLESIAKFVPKTLDYEVIIVDNNSTDGSIDYLKQIQISGVATVFFSKENLGFGKANNVGLRGAKGDYILILNPDTIFVEDCVSPLINWLNAHTDIAVCTCQHLDSEQKISATGGALPTLPKVLLWAWGIDDIFQIKDSYHPKAKHYVSEFNLGWITGAFMLLRKEVIKKAGMFDENIFLYGEEVEWCWRMNKVGLKIAFVPITKFIHFERKSSGDAASINSILGEFRGLKYIYGKHCAPWQQVLLGSILDIGAFMRMVYWLLRRNLPMAKIYMQAFTL